VLELAVLGGVDERVDTAAGVYQYHGEVIEPTVPEKKVLRNCVEHLLDKSDILTNS